jgi:hypothetical protein
MIDFDKVREYFETSITDTLLGMPIQHENVNDTKQLSEAKAKKRDWARLVIRQADAIAVSCGSNVLRRYSGIAIISIFCVQGRGTRKLTDLASSISSFILEQEFDSLLIRTPFFSIIGKTDDWFQGNVSIPFEFDQFTK